MKLYIVTYREWNMFFSDMYKCEKLSVGNTKDEAIERVKKVAAKDARYFDAEEIKSVFGFNVRFEDEGINDIDMDAVSIKSIVADVNKQNIFDVVIEEACRQWCCFIDEAPERKDGEGFADFFYEIFKDKEQEYLEAYNETHKDEPNDMKPTRQRIQSEKINNRQIIAEVDNEDNSIDIAVKVDDEPVVTLNVAIGEDDKVTIRKWIGFGDSVDETIGLEDIYDSEQDGMTMQ